MKTKRRRLVCILLPNKQHLDCPVGVRARGSEVLNSVLKQLRVSDLQVFGLAVLRDNEYLFLDLDQKLSKYFGKRWNRSSLMVPFILFLRVQYYVENGRLIFSSKVQQLYYTELRQNVLRSQSRHQEALFFQLAASALQAEVGDLLRHSPVLHGELTGVSRSQAVLQFIKEADGLQDGAGVSFEISAVGSLCLPKLVYYTQSVFHSKHVLRHLSDSHRLHINTRDAVSCIQQLENMQVSRFHKEAYICDITRLRQRLRCSNLKSTMSDCSDAAETATAWSKEEEEEEEEEEDEGSPSDAELRLDEPEEVFVDDPAEVSWLAELLLGVSVDGPLVLPASHWEAVTMEVKQVLWRRDDEGMDGD